MRSDFWILQTFNGLTYGALLFLLASGLSLIFGVMRVVNMAHGSYFLLGGYIGLTVALRTKSFALALVAGTVAIALVGIAMERLFLRRGLRPGRRPRRSRRRGGRGLPRRVSRGRFRSLALCIRRGDRGRAREPARRHGGQPHRRSPRQFRESPLSRARLLHALRPHGRDPGPAAHRALRPRVMAREPSVAS